MYSATDILKGIHAEAVRHGHTPLSSVKKQKLLYYCQAWALAWTGKPLYEDEIQAWDNGPVTPAARNFIPINSTVELNEDTRNIIAAVYEKYGCLDGETLSAMTHREAPWQDAYARGRNTPLSHEDMRRCQTEQSIKGNSPVKPYIKPVTIDRDTLLKLGEQAAEEWAHTLELLGQ